MATVPAPLFVLIILSYLALLNSADEGKESQLWKDCHPFVCGTLGELVFPFTESRPPGSQCPGFPIEGYREKVQKIQFEKGGRWYKVEAINQANIVTISDKALFLSRNCEFFINFTLPSHPYAPCTIKPTIFKCNRTLDNIREIEVHHSRCHNYRVYHNDPSSKCEPKLCSHFSNCSLIQLLNTTDFPNSDRLFPSFAKLPVELQLRHPNCTGSGKGYPFCPEGDRELKPKLGLRIAISGICTFIILALCFICFKWRLYFICFKRRFSKRPEDFQKIEAFIRANGFLAPKRYSYSDVKTMTKSFKEKLGHGGYGAVYKGKLVDGRDVAVKILKESKANNGESFINEVASISWTSHVNIVTLLGFCFEGHKRALIYEFVPNGSLEKFIYQENLMKANRDRLSWETLYQIAVGIANGLEYLHRGCNTRILHFDIKPHNILLDDDFCPKISDFGLAKLCPGKQSIVTITGARGTAGYIAPEVFSRSFGAVSHKSDVYSYGMMILEMVGGKRNSDAEADRTSEIYFPHWIYKRLELDEEIGLQGTGNELDQEKARKMILVGLWCIQTDPSDRPPISRVVEMLEGSLEALQIPPKPFVSSPPRPQAHISSSLNPEWQ